MGSSAVPEARSHSLPQGPGKESLSFFRQIQCGLDQEQRPDLESRPPLCPTVFCSSAPHSRRIENKKTQLHRLSRWPPQASPQPDAAQALSSVQETLESPARHPWLRAVLELQDNPVCAGLSLKFNVLHLLVFSTKHLAERALDLNSEVMRLYPLRSHKNSLTSPAFSHLHKQGEGPRPAPSEALSRR